MLGNDDVRISYVVTGTDPSPLYRNAIGDECVYVESGTGTVETVFGVLPLPHRRLRARPAGDRRTAGCPPEPSRLYAIEANSHIAPPKRYLSQVRPAARARAVLRARPARPERAARSSRATDVEVLVKHRVSNLPGGVGGTG